MVIWLESDKGPWRLRTEEKYLSWGDLGKKIFFKKEMSDLQSDQNLHFKPPEGLKDSNM